MRSKPKSKQTQTTTPVGGTVPTTASVADDPILQVVEEELVVGKRQVQGGGVRVTSHVVETPVQEQITLREETITVERHKVDRPVTAADQAFTAQSISMAKVDEEAVVSKTARVVEEVFVGKETTQRTETVRDTVRNSNVEIEQIAVRNAGNYDADYREHFQRAAVKGSTYDSYEPAYQYGSRMASAAQYQGKSFREMESLLQGDYQKANPHGTWEQAKSAVQYGWEKVTGQR